jgi:NADH-quinone oxidoreductase subunit J
MNISQIIFYLYSTLAIISAIMVIAAINPIHSVLFLILVFINASALLILLEVEFLAITFIIVYVGAIAVLFLFVVMMLNIKIVVSNLSLLRYIPIGGIITIIFLLELVLIFNYDFAPLFNINNINDFNIIEWTSEIEYITNIEAMGQLIYTYYYDLFLISGLVLLVAMNGAIVLTLHINNNVKRQQVFFQVYN